MAEAGELQRLLLSRQHDDGGWSFRSTASSWVEPTAFALLALEAAGYKGSACERGYSWLLRFQRGDGGWPPNPSVSISTSVTSFVALALGSSQSCAGAYGMALGWVARQTNPLPGPFERLKLWLQNIPADQVTTGGSPWLPGTAAWVAPTAAAIFAFSSAEQQGKRQFVPYRQRAQSYLLSRRCGDGGWNHGGSPYRSEGATSYPETTGIALLALEGIPKEQLQHSLEKAESMYKSPDSSEGQSWLYLALTRHGRSPAPIARALPWHTTRDIALQLLALTASRSTNRMRVGVAGRWSV